MMRAIFFSFLLTFLVSPTHASDHPLWIEYQGGSGPGSGKHVVLISGDEEYRSEEAMPLIGKILAQQHGFKCTVLFAIDPETGIINPNVVNNIPGLKALKSADLVILFTRFRALPDGQMRMIDDYLKTGRPIIGIRTSTHAFLFESPGKFSHYSNGYEGPRSVWQGGFGRKILGEKWIRHHGRHKHESTRGIIAPEAKSHPIARGLSEVDIWGPTDVYEVRLPLPGDSQPIVLGQVIQRSGEFQEKDLFFGMRPSDNTPNEEKNSPMMPIAWTKTYQLPGGQQGTAFTSTIGASTDLVSDGTRRLLVNAVYWCAGLGDRIPEKGTQVTITGFKPSAYGFRETEYWKNRQLKPEALK